MLCRKSLFSRVKKSVVMAGMAALVALGACQLRGSSRQPLSEAQKREEFDQLVKFIDDGYCYFAEKDVDWAGAVEHHRRRALAAQNRKDYTRALELFLDELYDPHTHLTVNYADSWRLVAHDVWAEWRDEAAVVTDVRAGSAAAVAGVEPGMRILAVNGEPVREAVAARAPKFAAPGNEAAKHWALLSVLSGTHDGRRVLRVEDRGGQRRELEIDESAARPRDEAAVVGEMLPGCVAYIHINTFADEAAVEQFDALLEQLRGSAGLIIDVRDNLGGDTQIARPIMGRLIEERQQYAWMAAREGEGLGERWPEYVEPRGPWTYSKPVVVLTDHWSVSMAEGFAMGLDGIGRATVVGTGIAGLGAATAWTELPHSEIGVQISSEPVYHVDGSPRTEFEPRVLVDRVAEQPAEPGGDVVLERGLEVLLAGVDATVEPGSRCE